MFEPLQLVRTIRSFSNTSILKLYLYSCNLSTREAEAEEMLEV